jgi:glycosyltransferase involved in cell wall biosynthesis
MRMNVIHALAWYFPASTGGTEVYVSGLVRELPAFGVASTIAAAHHGAQSLDYFHDGVLVHRYPSAEAVDLAETRGERPPQNFEAFVAWLERQPRRIYHQHSWATSCGLHHIAAAKSLGFKTVLTIHVPGNICLRGTMMEFGSDPCDGTVEVERCASCWSQERGLSQRAARTLSRIPPIISRTAYRSGAENRFFTALGARELAAARRRQITAMADVADRIVAVCGWLADALRRNGISDEKVMLSRQGVDRDFVGRALGQAGGSERFRLGFLGRSDPVKGLPVLLDAMARLPRDLALELVIHLVANTEQERRYRDTLIAKTAGDPRIRFMPPVGRAELPAVLAGFDMLAVPSQWKETGPLVVLEAQAVGVPVLGSDLGGIAELVEPGIDGHLVAFSDPAAWADAIRDAVEGALPCLGKTRMPRSVRTMADAAREMSALYEVLHDPRA